MDSLSRLESDHWIARVQLVSIKSSPVDISTLISNNSIRVESITCYYHLECVWLRNYITNNTLSVSGLALYLCFFTSSIKKRTRIFPASN